MREKREGRRQNRRSESGGWIRLLLFSLFLRRDLVLRSLQFRLFTTGVVSFFLGADRRRLVVWCIETSPFSETASAAPFSARYRRTLTINRNGPLPPASSPFSSAPTGVELCRVSNRKRRRLRERRLFLFFPPVKRRTCRLFRIRSRWFPPGDGGVDLFEPDVLVSA